jgi:acetylornithine deacetylase
MTSLQSAVRILGDLVAFDTTSRNSNLQLIDYVEDFLDERGIASVRVDHEPGRKTNLYATIGPEQPGGIVLSGHTDVVPVDGQSWTFDPFSLTERDSRLYGRGTTDMKGFLAAALASVDHFTSLKLDRPIHLAFSCDEEVGCRGVRPLIQYLVQHLPRPAAVIVGEPTLMKVVNAHKTAVSFETEVIGHEAHSSAAHQGVNAIMVASELVHELTTMARELKALGDDRSGFDPPYTTVHVGTIAGGTAKNIVPKRCSFVWETRLLPGDDADRAHQRLRAASEKLLPEMKAVSPECSITTRLINIVPGLEPRAGSPAESLALHLAQENGTGAVSYATEAGLFQQAGIASIICGPGSIEQAHKPDEFIAASELEACLAFMRRLGDYCSA